MFRDRRGSHEAHGLDVWMKEDSVHGFPITVNDVQNTGRKACLLEELPDQHGRRRIALRRLEHEGVAASDGDRIHPHRHHGREVERSDARDHTKRLTIGPAVDLGSDIAAELALQKMRDTTGKIDDVDATGKLTFRIGVRLPVFGRNQAHNRIGILLQQLLETEHRLNALERRRHAPTCGRTFRRCHGRVHLVRGRQRHFRNLLTRRRVVDWCSAAGRRCDPFSIDGVLKDVHGPTMPCVLARGLEHA
jgi:hypothetical protein